MSAALHSLLHPLGLKFFQGNIHQAVASAQGLCVFPAAPGLATIDTDPRYRDSLVQADTRYVDSGFLALCWFFLTFRSLSRISGLRFLQAFLADPATSRQKILWVHPTPRAQELNSLLATQRYGLPAALSSHYQAPLYPPIGEISDSALLAQINQFQPHIIIINLGGGTQEPLGAYIKANITPTPTILCTGGAIDFLTGAQAPIPAWADRLFLGWVFRILGTPAAQAKKMRISPSRRYLMAWRLLGLLIKYRGRLPQ